MIEKKGKGVEKGGEEDGIMMVGGRGKRLF